MPPKRKINKKKIINPEPKKSKKENKKIITKARNKILNELYCVLDYHEHKARKVEHSVYKFTLEYCQSQRFNIILDDISSEELDIFIYVYFNKAHDLIANLNSTGNTKLKKYILNRKVRAEKVAYLTPADLCRQRWETIINRKNTNEEKIKNMATTDKFTCPNCGKSKVRVEVKQVRRGDEPPTIFIYCTFCTMRTQFR